MKEENKTFQDEVSTESNACRHFKSESLQNLLNIFTVMFTYFQNAETM